MSATFHHEQATHITGKQVMKLEEEWIESSDNADAHLLLEAVYSCQSCRSHLVWHHPWRTTLHASPASTQDVRIMCKQTHEKVCTSHHTDQDSPVETVGQRQPVVHFSEQFWHLGSVLRFHFALKSIHLVHSLALMVACQQILFCILLYIKLTHSGEATCQSTKFQLQNSDACWGNMIWDKGSSIIEAVSYSSCFVSRSNQIYQQTVSVFGRNYKRHANIHTLQIPGHIWPT